MYKRLKGLYWPFVKYGVAFLLFHNTFYTLGIYTSTFGWNGKTNFLYGWTDIFARLADIIAFRGGGENLLGAFWFLPVLFFSSVGAMLYFWVSKKIIKKSLYACVVGVGFFLFLAAVLSKLDLSVWEINKRTMFAGALYLIGFMLHKYFERILLHKKTIAIGGLIMVLGATLLYPRNMTTMTGFFDIGYFLAICMGGILAVLAISKMLEKTHLKSFLVFVGENTLVILALHFLCFKLVNYAKICYYDMDFDMLSCFPIIFNNNNAGWMFLYCLAGILIPLAIPAITGFAHGKLSLQKD